MNQTHEERDHTLLLVYQTAVYRFLHRAQQFELKVNGTNTEVGKLLQAKGVSKAAFLTAFNPQSVILSQEENQQRHEALIKRIRSLNLEYLEGYSTDQEGEWPKEVSLFALGISNSQAEEIAVEFNQKGYLFIRDYKNVELHLTEDTFEEQSK